MIVGLGLMGGSLGLALRRGVPGIRVSGTDLVPAVVARALALGAIDRAVSPRDEDLGGYQTVFLAVPVSRIVPLAREIAPRMAPGSVLTDLGSVKAPIHEHLAGFLPAGVAFVGGHPMTGSEVEGLDGADAHLFENAVYVLTVGPGEDRGGPGYERLATLVSRIGAIAVPMDPSRHDRIVTFVSHLPYVMAVSLVNVMKEAFPRVDEALALAAGGFHDSTRVAACPETIFGDILTANAPGVVAGLDRLVESLRQVREDLVRGDGEALHARLAVARSVRRTLPPRHRADPLARFDLVVKAEDRPGFLGDLATLLGEHEINIKDFVLMQVREWEAGTIRLSFAREADLDSALELLAGAGFMVTRR